MVICADNDKTSSNCRPNFATESTKIAVVLVCIGTARFRYCKQPTSFNNLALVESSAPNSTNKTSPFDSMPWTGTLLVLQMSDFRLWGTHIGALLITNTILVALCYNYSIAGPKALF